MELEKATFSMQEVMVLAMLHAKQMTLLRASYEAKLEEERNKIPPPPVVDTQESQTDFPPIVETVVEEVEVIKEITKEVEVVVTKEVEVVVTKEITVEVPVEVIKKVKEIVVVEKEVEAPFVYAPDGKKKLRKLRNYSVRDPLYLADCPDDFFDRLNFFTARKLKNLGSLSDKTMAAVRRGLEGEMHAKHTLELNAVDSLLTTQHDDVILPALYAPTPGVTYASNASGRFHAGGEGSERYTQPPATAALRPLPYRLEQGAAMTVRQRRHRFLPFPAVSGRSPKRYPPHPPRAP